MQHRILIGINTQVGKTMLIFRPALKNECRSEENYSWSAKPANTSNGEHWTGRQLFLLGYDVILYLHMIVIHEMLFYFAGLY
jgi:hypothetical protein